MDRPWLLVVLAPACTVLFSPPGLMVSAGGSLYAHRTGSIGLRNVLLMFCVALLLLIAVPLSPSNL